MATQASDDDDHRGRLQRRLGQGWNTWDTTSLLTHVLLPCGLAIRLGIKEYARGRTLADAQLGVRDEGAEVVTLGGHSVLGGHSSLIIRWSGVELRVRTASVGEDLVILVEPLSHEVAAAVVAEVCFLWNRPGTVRHDGSIISAQPATGSTGPIGVHTTGEPIDDPYVGARGPYFVVRLDAAVGFSTGAPRTLPQLRAEIERAEAAAESELEAYGPDEHAMIIRDAIGWNTILEPQGDRVITTVSRLWNVGKRGGFAMFCWDAFFNALLASVHDRDLAYANVIEMVAELTPEGFVPNVAQGTGRRTYDGSQPPIGSLVAWQLYRQFGDRWFLREVFDGLLSWNRWWWRVRRSGDLLSLGSTTFTPQWPSPQDVPRIGQHFGATCESGCDNHPVFADVLFDSQTGLLRAHDVGLNAEYVADCEALAAIATELGETDAATELTERGAGVAARIEDVLWDEESGSYRSHFSDTGRPTASLSPMSFYPLLAGLGVGERARRMTALLDDSDVFGGEWVLPSSPRTDPSVAVQSYWSGRAWPPVNFLVYLGLIRSGASGHAAWLAERSRAMVLREWSTLRHVHENYSSATGDGCDVANSEPYYSWGALLSLIVLIEDGRSDLFGDRRQRA